MFLNDLLHVVTVEDAGHLPLQLQLKSIDERRRTVRLAYFFRHAVGVLVLRVRKLRPHRVGLFFALMKDHVLRVPPAFLFVLLLLLLLHILFYLIDIV